MEYRKKESLNQDWKTMFGKVSDVEPDPVSPEWKEVSLPHNWEDYQGYRCLSHGNLHGTAWYQRTVRIPAGEKRHCFIEFEGAGSYLKVWCNGRFAGEHKGGRTCYTAELTDMLNPEGENRILVRTDHPDKIKDLPWVCGGCWGTPNTEGSQPLGIFRPVSLYTTGDVRVQPFGVDVQYRREEDGRVQIRVKTELKNLCKKDRKIILIQELYDPSGKLVEKKEDRYQIGPSEERTEMQDMKGLQAYQLWETDAPALYTVRTLAGTEEDEGWSDEVENTFGIRFIEWENFENAAEELPDQKLLLEKPSLGNEYFVKRGPLPKRKSVEILPGGIKVRGTEKGKDSVVLEIETELFNADTVSHSVEVESFVQTYNRTKSIADIRSRVTLAPGETMTVKQKTTELLFLDRWSRERPYYYQISSTLWEQDAVLLEPVKAWTPFGLEDTDDEEAILNKAYPYVKKEGEESCQKHRFFLNGRPVLIQGTCEYEHLLGNDHAFSEKQIYARMRQIQAAGFNASTPRARSARKTSPPTT